MSNQPMSEMMKGVYDKTTEGPVGIAVKYIDDCVQASVAKGLFGTVALWKACAVVIDHVKVQREALLLAGNVITLFERGDVKATALMIEEFKRAATKARLHQFVEPTQYPKLEEQFKPTPQ